MSAQTSKAHVVTAPVIDAILAQYGMQGGVCTALAGGNINETYRVEHRGMAYILQRLNPIFSPTIHDDIEAVTAHLERRAMVTARLVKTLAGSLYTPCVDRLRLPASVWHVLTYVPGRTYAQATSPELCNAAGQLLGRFHATLADFTQPFSHVRHGVHDTAAHLQALKATLASHTDHVAYAALLPLAQKIMAALESLPPLPAQPLRVTHGDPKLSNMVFSEGPLCAGLAMIDLDTLCRMPLALELGDAMRSWCNPHAESHQGSYFSLAHFSAALEGYAAVGGLALQPAEITALKRCSLLITLELACRFARDTLEESYFKWDARRFEHAWAHNLQRTRSQWALAESYAAQAPAASALVDGIFGHRAR